jgi:hypothetical protein
LELRAIGISLAFKDLDLEPAAGSKQCGCFLDEWDRRPSHSDQGGNPQ